MLPFKGAALPKTDYFVTPLGAVQVNKELSAALTSQPGFKFLIWRIKMNTAWRCSCLLQKVLKIQNNSVVYGDASPQELSVALEPLLRQPDTLLVVSG